MAKVLHNIKISKFCGPIQNINVIAVKRLSSTRGYMHRCIIFPKFPIIQVKSISYGKNTVLKNVSIVLRLHSSIQSHKIYFPSYEIAAQTRADPLPCTLLKNISGCFLGSTQ